MINPTHTADMTQEQRELFYAEYKHASKDEVTGILLAFFLGGLGFHRFYMGQAQLGFLYLIFSWTGIPTVIGFFECFAMPGRVQACNAMQAQLITVDILESTLTSA